MTEDNSVYPLYAAEVSKKSLNIVKMLAGYREDVLRQKQGQRCKLATRGLSRSALLARLYSPRLGLVAAPSWEGLGEYWDRLLRDGFQNSLGGLTFLGLSLYMPILSACLFCCSVE